MTQTLWGFGDSWGEGWRVGIENSYTNLLAAKLGLNCVNYSRSGSSLGLVTDTLLKHHDEFQAGDSVLVTVPSDRRWYQQRLDNQMGTITSFDDEEYMCVMKLSNAEPYWFEWHHSQFINTIRSLCELHGVTLYMQHNIGEHRILEEMQPLGLQNYFLDTEHSMAEWLGSPKWSSYEDSNDQLCWGKFCEDNPYFWDDRDNHPNFDGHQRIAEILSEKIQGTR